MKGRTWLSLPVYLCVGLTTFFLVTAFAWPIEQPREEVVFRDAVDHVWWGVPRGFLMGTCYEFARESAGEWWIRCGAWQFRYNDESGHLRPADASTQRAWDYAVELHSD